MATLKTPEGSRFSELERLRRPPTWTTGTAFVRALKRVDEIGAYRLGRLRLSQIPPNRMTGWPGARWRRRRRCWSGRAEPKRTAILTAVMRPPEAKAIDEALDRFQVLMATRLLNTAKRKTEKMRLSTLLEPERSGNAQGPKPFGDAVRIELQGADLGDQLVPDLALDLPPPT